MIRLKREKIEPLVSVEVKETVSYYSDFEPFLTVETGNILVKHPDLGEVVVKVNEIIAYLNEQEERYILEDRRAIRELLDSNIITMDFVDSSVLNGFPDSLKDE